MSASDFFRKFQPLFEAKDYDLEKEAEKATDKKKADKEDAAVEALDKKDKKPSNVKENAADFFRKYADMITEAEDEDEEDPDVVKADKEKGKDGQTQKDAEKKLPPWLKGNESFKKKDKKDEDNGAKKAKKEDL